MDKDMRTIRHGLACDIDELGRFAYMLDFSRIAHMGDAPQPYSMPTNDECRLLRLGFFTGLEAARRVVEHGLDDFDDAKKKATDTVSSMVADALRTRPEEG